MEACDVVQLIAKSEEVASGQPPKLGLSVVSGLISVIKYLK
jgi:hypothetical protein